MPAMTIEQALQLALAHHQAGRLAEAEALYRQILTQQPNHTDSLHLLGVIALQFGRDDVAVDLISKAISIKPNIQEGHNNLGIALKNQG
jgi:protein O-GlcNAc transferase